MSGDLWQGEQVVLCHDRALAMHAVVAIDDTTLGPGLGGVRYRAYPSAAAAVAEAQRLAAAMTLKNAAAELPYGGAKSVLVHERPPEDRSAFMRAFGQFVARLGGAYIPAMDMGTTTGDMAELARVVPDVATDDPSPATAVGVWAGIRAAVEHVDGTDVSGKRVAIQGVGHVGADLARRLAHDGADVVVADADPRRARDVAAETGGRAVDPAEILFVECDVLAPCAVAKVFDSQSIPRLNCRIVAGAANDTLADGGYADVLADRGITYVPDFLINAGGVIHIHGLRSAWEPERIHSELLEIGRRVKQTLTEAESAATSTLAAAERRAYARLGRPVPRTAAAASA